MNVEDTGFEPRLQGGNAHVRADLTDLEVVAAVGEPTIVRLQITNVDTVIRSFRVSVLGLDPAWLDVDDAAIDLFPDERREVDVAITLPEAFPSGRHSVAVEVAEDGGLDPVLVAFDLVTTPVPAMTLTVEPESLTVGASGTFLLHPANLGNTRLQVALRGDDPERLTTVTFEPPTGDVVPGERGLVRAEVVGQRPWVGMPAVRVLTFTADAGVTTASAVAVLIQKPRISRRALALLGLLAAITLFAFVILQAFSSVAERADANDALLRSGLGADEVVGARTAPATLGGRVTSTTTGGVDSAAVELFDRSNPALPVRSTVTDANGSFRFAAVSDGTYLVRVEVAGFDARWFPAAESIADASEVEVTAGTTRDDLDVELVGRPGSVSGAVLGEEVAGATVAARVPADALEGSELEPIPAVVASVELDATGRFVLEDLPTPATYELVVTQPGFATDVSTVALRPGEQRDGIEVLLRRGDGRIAGTVTDPAGTLLGNVVIEATDGATTTTTRTLSGDGELGTFELRDLPTPGTYTLSVQAPGFVDETVTLSLDAEQRLEDVALVLIPATGSISGQVTDPAGAPLGGIDITITGSDLARTTTSLSVGEVGAWFADDLPVPGTYTITFGGPGTTTQAVSVELTTGAGATRTGVDAVLASATASLGGTVTEPGTGPIGGVQIEVDGADVERRTISSDRPAGAYGVDDLPPGAYTITYSRPGSRAQTLLVELAAGESVTLPNVALEPQARLVGTVTRDGIGESGVGVVVYAQADFPRQVAAEAVTGPGGTFELVGLDAPETYILEFRIPAGGSVVGSRTVFLPPGEVTDVAFGL